MAARRCDSQCAQPSWRTSSTRCSYSPRSCSPSCPPSASSLYCLLTYWCVRVRWCVRCRVSYAVSGVRARGEKARANLECGGELTASAVERGEEVVILGIAGDVGPLLQLLERRIGRRQQRRLPARVFCACAHDTRHTRSAHARARGVRVESGQYRQRGRRWPRPGSSR